MTITFAPMQLSDLPLWQQWIEYPHVKNTWFIEGYEPPEKMQEKITGNGYDYPFIFALNDVPIGYLQASDLYAYRSLCENPQGVFTQESEGTWCFDLFIGEPDYLDRGFGSKIVRQFAQHLIDQHQAEVILIDPAADNLRAIRCYEKAGFVFDHNEFDGVTEVHVMRFKP